uniref:Secreted protein n=1 Tax=Steinernema glaseri TaxID=37863 RepID=A0A1I7Y5E7_9BILA
MMFGADIWQTLTPLQYSRVDSPLLFAIVLNFPTKEWFPYRFIRIFASSICSSYSYLCNVPPKGNLKRSFTSSAPLNVNSFNSDVRGHRTLLLLLALFHAPCMFNDLRQVAD